ncbi:flavodoxin I [Cytobacillus eiseniae]|uniref:Flavodoxin I n=1 Tax=Cytobacillus eiseniae TaxID=762947 RepID=A0ABS4RAB8_9BACI|nr:flavodoxin domain-containing protein [Cytobacillus eiseniae]MBP2239830.1 flavodoxin I [Cytobacillus eiseniae]
MGLMNCKMKVAIVYTSITGNTKELAKEIYRICKRNSLDIDLYKMDEFHEAYLYHYHVLAIGTYTWGNGEIPKEMKKLYHALEALNRKELITAIFGTGDSFYPNYCGAVDLFRDMLYVQTSLAATLKVELLLQKQDDDRCERFVESIVRQAKKSSLAPV